MRGFELSWIGLKRILKSLEETYGDSHLPDDLKQSIVSLLNQCEPHEIKYIGKNMPSLMTKVQEKEEEEKLQIPSIFIKEKIHG